MQDEYRDDEGGSEDPGPAIEQFQRAALDAVNAARAMLDAAESIIKDPASIESVVQTVTSFARTAGETVVGFAAGASGAPTPRSSPSPSAPGDDESDSGFERIRVD